MYKWLLSDANAKHLGLLHAPRIILAGDSAGANLCCALMIRVTSSFFPSSLLSPPLSPLPFPSSLLFPFPLLSSPPLSSPLSPPLFPSSLLFPFPLLSSPLSTSPLLLLSSSPFLLLLPSFHFLFLLPSSPFSLPLSISPSLFPLPSSLLSLAPSLPSLSLSTSPSLFPSPLATPLSSFLPLPSSLFLHASPSF